jgi:[methyl-Co(III) methanol-specific corrinoid protein]:coenzyme M methyltransferase
VDTALDVARVPVLLEAVAIASDEAGELPVVVNVLGPVTLAASLVEPTALLRAMLEAPDQVHSLLAQLEVFLTTLVGRLSAAGANVVAIHEDMGDPRSVGAKLFAAFTVEHLSRVVALLRGSPVPVATTGHAPLCVCPACRITTTLESMRRSMPVVLHCCELTPGSWAQLPRIGASAVSVGHTTNIGALLEQQSTVVAIGNVSTHLLDRGTPEQVRQHARRAIRAGASVLAPECGPAMSTPLANVRALVEAAYLDDLAPAPGPVESEANP